MQDNFSDDSYQSIAKRDGEYCALCGATAAETKLVVSDKYGDLAATPDKILLCMDCKNRKSLYELCASERTRIKKDTCFTTELQVNRQKENRFRLFVYEKLSERNNIQWQERDLINSGAEVLGISTTTARRYLDKMCSSAGVLLRQNDGEDSYVSFNTKGFST